VIGTDIQNTTLPNKGPAKSKDDAKRQMLKGIVLGKLKK
jgi:hypothetical protein